jgi:hypothetical protein
MHKISFTPTNRSKDERQIELYNSDKKALSPMPPNSHAGDDMATGIIASALGVRSTPPVILSNSGTSKAYDVTGTYIFTPITGWQFIFTTDSTDILGGVHVYVKNKTTSMVSMVATVPFSEFSRIFSSGVAWDNYCINSYSLRFVQQNKLDQTRSGSVTAGVFNRPFSFNSVDMLTSPQIPINSNSLNQDLTIFDDFLVAVPIFSLASYQAGGSLLDLTQFRKVQTFQYTSSGNSVTIPPADIAAWRYRIGESGRVCVTAHSTIGQGVNVTVNLNSQTLPGTFSTVPVSSYGAGSIVPTGSPVVFKHRQDIASITVGYVSVATQVVIVDLYSPEGDGLIDNFGVVTMDSANATYSLELRQHISLIPNSSAYVVIADTAPDDICIMNDSLEIASNFIMRTNYPLVLRGESSLAVAATSLNSINVGVARAALSDYFPDWANSIGRFFWNNRNKFLNLGNSILNGDINDLISSALSFFSGNQAALSLACLSCDLLKEIEILEDVRQRNSRVDFTYSHGTVRAVDPTSAESLPLCDDFNSLNEYNLNFPSSNMLECDSRVRQPLNYHTKQIIRANECQALLLKGMITNPADMVFMDLSDFRILKLSDASRDQRITATDRIIYKDKWYAASMALRFIITRDKSDAHLSELLRANVVSSRVVPGKPFFRLYLPATPDEVTVNGSTSCLEVLPTGTRIFFANNSCSTICSLFDFGGELLGNVFTFTDKARIGLVGGSDPDKPGDRTTRINKYLTENEVGELGALLTRRNYAPKPTDTGVLDDRELWQMFFTKDKNGNFFSVAKTNQFAMQVAPSVFVVPLVDGSFNHVLVHINTNRAAAPIAKDTNIIAGHKWNDEPRTTLAAFDVPKFISEDAESSLLLKQISNFMKQQGLGDIRFVVDFSFPHDGNPRVFSGGSWTASILLHLLGGPNGTIITGGWGGYSFSQMNDNIIAKKWEAVKDIRNTVMFNKSGVLFCCDHASIELMKQIKYFNDSQQWSTALPGFFTMSGRVVVGAHWITEPSHMRVDILNLFPNTPQTISMLNQKMSDAEQFNPADIVFKFEAARPNLPADFYTQFSYFSSMNNQEYTAPKYATALNGLPSTIPALAQYVNPDLLNRYFQDNYGMALPNDIEFTPKKSTMDIPTQINTKLNLDQRKIAITTLISLRAFNYIASKLSPPALNQLRAGFAEKLRSKNLSSLTIKKVNLANTLGTAAFAELYEPVAKSKAVDDFLALWAKPEFKTITNLGNAEYSQQQPQQQQQRNQSVGLERANNQYATGRQQPTQTRYMAPSTNYATQGTPNGFALQQQYTQNPPSGPFPNEQLEELTMWK